jgi:hypothetical protein
VTSAPNPEPDEAEVARISLGVYGVAHPFLLARTRRMVRAVRAGRSAADSLDSAEERRALQEFLRANPDVRARISAHNPNLVRAVGMPREPAAEER